MIVVSESQVSIFTIGIDKIIRETCVILSLL